MDRLLSVYQGDANVVADEGEVHIFAWGPVAAARVEVAPEGESSDD